MEIRLKISSIKLEINLKFQHGRTTVTLNHSYNHQARHLSYT